MLLDTKDPALRERLAEESYLRAAREQVAANREHEMDDDVTYLVLSWECLSAAAQRPFRVAVAHTLEAVDEAV